MKAFNALGCSVPFKCYFMLPEEKHVRAISFRENLRIMADTCGLTGWAYINVVGQQRDKLRDNGKDSSGASVVRSFAGVVWSSGRELTVDSAAKIMAIWNRLANLPAARAMVAESLKTYGKQSQFEDWTVLGLLLGKIVVDSDVLWVVETIHYERLRQIRSDNYSAAEIRKKVNIAHLALLRKKSVLAMVEKYVEPAMQLAAEKGQAVVSVRFYRKSGPRGPHGALPGPLGPGAPGPPGLLLPPPDPHRPPRAHPGASGIPGALTSLCSLQMLWMLHFFRGKLCSEIVDCTRVLIF